MLTLKLKHYVAIGMVIALGLSIAIGMNLRSKLLIERSKVAALEVTNTLIAKEKQRLDSLIGFYAYSVQIRDSAIAKKDRQIQHQVSDIVALENALKGLQGTLAKVSADSSYKYINQRVIPTSELKYKFDSTQVKTIHYTFLERDQLTYLNLKNSLVIGDLLQNAKLKDLQIKDLKDLNSLHISKEAILRKEYESKEIEVEGLGKANKQLKRQKNWIIGGAAGVATIIIIKSIAK
jgi:hypothetical protein